MLKPFFFIHYFMSPRLCIKLFIIATKNILKSSMIKSCFAVGASKNIAPKNDATNPAKNKRRQL